MVFLWKTKGFLKTKGFSQKTKKFHLEDKLFYAQNTSRIPMDIFVKRQRVFSYKVKGSRPHLSVISGKTNDFSHRRPESLLKEDQQDFVQTKWRNLAKVIKIPNWKTKRPPHRRKPTPCRKPSGILIEDQKAWNMFPIKIDFCCMRPCIRSGLLSL